MNKGSLLEKITYFSILWSCIFLPLKTTISNAGLILLFISTIISFGQYGIRKGVLTKPLFYGGTTLALFIPILLGSLYAPSLTKAFAQLGKCFFYAAIPLIVLRTDMDRAKAIMWGSRGLIIGVTIGLVYLFYNNAETFIKSGLPLEKILSYNFTGKAFLTPIREMHPVYFGSYALFALFLMWQLEFKLKRFFKILLTILMIIGLIFLNSRMLFLIGGILVFLFFLRGITLKRSLIGLGVLILFFLLIVPSLKGTYVYNKIVEGSKWDMTENIASKNLDSDQTADSRMSRWLVSRDIFIKKPVFGHGTGSARDLLMNAYDENNMKASLQQGYDSHNQYLGYAIEYGILGMLFLGVFFGGNIYSALRSKFMLLFVFMFLVGLLCITENYLIRNMGINFVALFGNLLILDHYD